VTTGTGLTIVDDTYYRLGIIAETTGVRFYVNGALVSTLTTNIPTAALAPALVNQGNATVTSVMNLDRVRILGYK
jgi:xanthine/uracil/vitamin C permease (AzgA family)